MRKSMTVVSILALICLLPAAWGQCTTIQQGVLKYSAGHYLYPQPLKTGYDVFGYNYQAHLFNGSYANAYLGRYGFPPYEGDDEAYLAANPTVVNTWVWPYRRDHLSMKWNDAWLSNKDCDGDGLLDRHNGFPSYIGSGAWLTNHQSGDIDPITREPIPHWTYFTKIVAVPTSAVKTLGVWYLEGTEIGPDIWGEFATIQMVYNDPSAGAHGILYKSPTNPGFGFYQP